MVSSYAGCQGAGPECANPSILDAAARTTVLALHAGGVLALSEEAYLVHNEYPVTLAEFVQRRIRALRCDPRRYPNALAREGAVHHRAASPNRSASCQPVLRSTIPANPSEARDRYRSSASEQTTKSLIHFFKFILQRFFYLLHSPIYVAMQN